MRSFLTLVAIFVLLVRIESSKPYFTSPLFMWSNTEYFVGRNVHVDGYLSSEEVSHFLTKQESKIQKYLNEKRIEPEVIFVFVEPELRTEQFPMLANSHSSHPNGGAFGKLKGTMESYSTSSISIPYTHVGDSNTIASSIISKLKRNLAEGAKILLAKDTDSNILGSIESEIERVSLDQLKSASNKWDLLSNGKTDVIVVCFNSPVLHMDNIDQVTSNYAADDAYINSLLHSFGSSYLAIFTAESPAAEEIKQARATMIVRQLNDNSIYPSDIVQAHIVMIPFLIILFVGICCTCSVQSELKFDAEKKTYKK